MWRYYDEPALHYNYASTNTCRRDPRLILLPSYMSTKYVCPLLLFRVREELRRREKKNSSLKHQMDELCYDSTPFRCIRRRFTRRLREQNCM